MLNKHLIFLLTIVFFATIGCEEKTRTESEVSLQAETGQESTIGITRKPGAPISFSSNYDGESEPGIPETIIMTFISEESGELTVSLQAEPNILQGSDIDMIYEVVAGEAVDIPATVILPDSNKYYVNIQTTLKAESQSQSRAFALALFPAKTSLRSNKVDDTLRAVQQQDSVIMDAEESIKPVTESK